jgi:hypothetical protein
MTGRGKLAAILAADILDCSSRMARDEIPVTDRGALG